jgi:exopolysaccharide production protein ExoQ
MSSSYFQQETPNVDTLASVVTAPSRHSAFVLPAVWQQTLTWLLFWPLLCLIARQAPYFAGLARDATFYTQGAPSREGSDYHASLYVILAFQAAFAAFAHKAIWAKLKENPLVLAGLVLVLVSAVWSGSFSNTVHMGIEVCLATFFACYLIVRMSTERLMSLLMFMGIASSLLSILFALALPRYGIFAGYSGGAWQGIADHKNSLGDSMVYLLTPVFFAQQYSLSRRLSYGAVILFIIFMSQSRGAWMYTVGLVFFVGCLYAVRHLRSKESLLLIILVVCLVAAIGLTAATSFDTIASLLGKDPSMSGRTEVYPEIWRSILKKPILGYGYGGFWGVSSEVSRIETIIRSKLGYAESGVLDLALQLGFVGVGLVLLMLGRALVQGIRLVRSPAYSPRSGWFLTILVLAGLTNIEAGWFLVSNNFDWLLILIACIGLDAETRRARTPEHDQTGSSYAYTIHDHRPELTSESLGDQAR